MQFPVLWSLSVEEHFYIVWPVLVRNLNRKLLGITALVIVFVSAAWRLKVFLNGSDLAPRYTWLVMDGLAMGALLALLSRELSRKFVTLISLTALAAGIICWVDRLTGMGEALHVLGANLASLGIVGLALLLASGGRFALRSSILEFFGYISYGLYLIHMVVANIFDRFVPTNARSFPMILARFSICTAIAVLLAFLSRRYFEARFLKLKDGKGSKPSLPAAEPVCH